MQISRPVLAHEVLRVTGGMVVAQDRLGARIGAEVLQRGGNAVDAAVTTAFAMGVLQPLMNGVGGGGLLVAGFASGERGSVDFGMRAAGAARPDMYELEGGTDRPEAGGLRFSRGYAWPLVKDRANLHGHAAIAVPGTAAGLAAALDRWGTMSLDQALLPAIRLARAGFPVGHHFVLALVNGREVMWRHPATRETYYPGGHPIPVGGTLVQSDHARTLELIARHGPDGFYRGEVAERIDEEMAANGGTIRRADLAAYRPFVHDTVLEGRYRGTELLAVPGPNAGTAVVEVLNILQHFDLAPHGWGSVEALHLVIEAIRRAAVDRYSYLGDHPDAPFDILPEPGYAETRARTISPGEAGPPVAGDPWAYQGVCRPTNLPAPAGVSMDGGTTHISVVDADRNAVGLTQTNMSYSGVIVPGVGVMMNNAMTWFYPGPGTVNSIVPGGRGMNNMTPLILVRGGRLHAVLGASGGRRIWSALIQGCVNHLDFGMGLQDAVQAPRLHVESDQVLLDGRFGAEVRAGLEKLGHEVTVATPYYDRSPYAEPNGVQVVGDELHSAVYPVAKPTHAAGYLGDTLEDSGGAIDTGIDAGMLSHP